jgi:hypothetical protein
VTVKQHHRQQRMVQVHIGLPLRARPWRPPFAQCLVQCLAQCLVLFTAFGLGVPHAQAVVGVHPFGVNVRSSGSSTVFLTFQGLGAGERAAGAFWCGALRPALMAANPQLQQPVAVQGQNPCLPGTVYGQLPAALDRSRASSSGAFATLTDIMTIPASVARRAYQDAQAGRHSAFFYVRRFVGPEGDRWVVVTCRMGGGGARTPLALMGVRLAFETPDQASAVTVIERGQPLPGWSARLTYNGSGVLRGRWELVQPGETPPETEDLLTAATLPAERRVLQRRWHLIDRFEVFLPPTGEARLIGPDPARVPTDVEGPYQLLLRVEATADKEAASDTGGGRVVQAGGVAAFPMPVLRYHVSSARTPPASSRHADTVELLDPPAGADVAAETLRLSWAEPPGRAMMRVDIEAGRQRVWTAYVQADRSSYSPPPWFVQAHIGKPLRWRVVSLATGLLEPALSPWRALQLHGGESRPPADLPDGPTGTR